MAQLIKQAYLLGADAANVGAEGMGDVLIEEGVISAIAPFLTDHPPNTEIIDGRGQFLGPGLIDLYSHSGEPGHESRETLQSLRAAAAAGGFTRVGVLPTTMPAVDSVGAIATFQQSNQLATNESINESINESVNQSVLMPWAAITLGAKGEQLSELAELINAGAIGFADGRPLMNKVLLRRLLEYAQPLQKPIALWPCDIDLAKDGIAREGVDSIRLGLAGTSAIAETTALATMLEYLVEVPALVHVMRVSTARSVDLIREAKSRNLPISASVPWHHLLFDTTDLESYSPHLKQDPPLGTPRDRTALIEAVSEGVIDAIAIDHSPYTYEEKTVSFKAAPPGAIGLELALPLLWQTFVSAKATDKRWSPMQLWQSLSEGPAQCLGQSAGQLEVGAPAELALFNPAFEWDVAADTLESLSSNTPWLSKRIAGRVTQIWNQ